MTAPDNTAAQPSSEKHSGEKPSATSPVEDFPFVALSIKATGIHPSTGRLVAVDVVTFDEQGNIGEEFHQVLNPGGNPGPVHAHGLTPQDTHEGKRFSTILKTLCRLIDRRTLIVHNSPMTWGFIVSEARRAMNAAARANRSRSRNGSGGGRGRRRQKVGHVPRPERIIDVLASARRQGITIDDTRVRGLAAALRLDTAPPMASLIRADLPEATTTREETMLLIDMFAALDEAGVLDERHPKDQRANRFGLQRSHIRVDAAEAPRPIENPGVLETKLLPGMEVVVAPEITMDPDEIIEGCMRRELAYSEKLTRQTSVVVCNQRDNLTGKAMHAERKNIPLVSDVEFMALLDQME